MSLLNSEPAAAETDAEFFSAGEQRALALDNRGPIRYDADGTVHHEIVDAYWRHGFYVFEDVVDAIELAELRADLDAVLDRAPYPNKKSPTDKHGRPALGREFALNPWHMAAPLSDPWGGTDRNNGRHPVKMTEPAVQTAAPEHVPFMMSGLLQFSETFLRVYGHPDLLRVAEAVNGPDFTPFNEVLFIKEPGIGPSVAWHQDGQIHWDSPDWNEGIHGFNFQVQLYGSTPRTGVWVVPGTHRLGKIDIAAMVADAGGTERLPNAVPLVCKPGDCTMVNRQTLHGSFANTSADRRVTVNFGFHRYSSVIDQRGKLSGDGNFYDAAYVDERCRSIQLAIDARRQHFPHETPYAYAPYAGREDEARYGPDTAAALLKDYNLKDLGI